MSTCFVMLANGRYLPCLLAQLEDTKDAARFLADLPVSINSEEIYRS
jgi:hypothetical protein